MALRPKHGFIPHGGCCKAPTLLSQPSGGMLASSCCRGSGIASPRGAAQGAWVLGETD